MILLNRRCCLQTYTFRSVLWKTQSGTVNLCLCTLIDHFLDQYHHDYSLILISRFSASLIYLYYGHFPSNFSWQQFIGLLWITPSFSRTVAGPVKLYISKCDTIPSWSCNSTLRYANSNVIAIIKYRISSSATNSVGPCIPHLPVHEIIV